MERLLKNSICNDNNCNPNIGKVMHVVGKLIWAQHPNKSSIRRKQFQAQGQESFPWFPWKTVFLFLLTVCYSVVTTASSCCYHKIVCNVGETMHVASQQSWRKDGRRDGSAEENESPVSVCAAVPSQKFAAICLRLVARPSSHLQKAEPDASPLPA